MSINIANKDSSTGAISLLRIAGSFKLPDLGENLTLQNNKLDISEVLLNKVTKLDSDVTKTELSYVHGVTSGIQSQINGKANSSHTHTKSNITDFAHTHVKSDITDFSHTHTKSNITDFAHTHAQTDITGLDTALSGKANSTHTHAQTDVTGLQDTLNSKADTSVATSTSNGLMSAEDKATLDKLKTLLGKTLVEPSLSGSTLSLTSFTITQ